MIVATMRPYTPPSRKALYINVIMRVNKGMKQITVLSTGSLPSKTRLRVAIVKQVGIQIKTKEIMIHGDKVQPQQGKNIHSMIIIQNGIMVMV